MGDFLGSYYTNFLEDEGMSGRMALLKAEQPVSILAMEKLVSSNRSEGVSSEIDKPNSASSIRRSSVIDNLQIRSGADGDFVPGISRADSLDDPDLEIPVASMSLFEQESMMVSVQLKSLEGGALKKPSDDSGRDGWREAFRLRSRSTTDVRGKYLDNFSTRARTTDFDIDSPTTGTDGSFSGTPRTGDTFFGAGKRATTLRTSLFKLFGRKKKYENTSKRK